MKKKNKCKNCNKEFEQFNSTKNTCSVKCKLELERMKREEKAKKLSIRISGISDKEQSKKLREDIEHIMPNYLEGKQVTIKVRKGKVRTEKQSLSDKADKLWSKCVRRLGICEYCGSKEYLNGHHILTRANKTLRLDLRNGVCLCADHHQFSSEFSAHGTPSIFRDWISGKRSDDIEYLLNIQGLVTKFSEDYLKEKIKSFEIILTDCQD